MTIIVADHHLYEPAVQVVVPPLLQVHATDASEDVDVAHCTQTPMTNASTGSKRLRKERLSKALAEGGGRPRRFHRGDRDRGR